MRWEIRRTLVPPRRKPSRQLIKSTPHDAPMHEVNSPKAISNTTRYEKSPLKSPALVRETQALRRPLLFPVRCVSTPRAPTRPIVFTFEPLRHPPSNRLRPFRPPWSSEELSADPLDRLRLLERTLLLRSSKAHCSEEHSASSFLPSELLRKSWMSHKESRTPKNSFISLKIHDFRQALRRSFNPLQQIRRPTSAF